ncbi:MAG: polysaccharide deacetylase family protein [Polyangiales bacterium]
MVRIRTIALVSTLALMGCMADPDSVDDIAHGDDQAAGDSVSVENAGAIGVRVPSSLGLDRRGKFYLTFDDGPSAQYTPRILATLRAHHASATFFITGANIAGNESVIRDLLAQGHNIANHQWSHVIATPAQLRTWAPREADLLDSITGRRLPRLFRYPYGSGTAEKETILRSFGYSDGGIGWDLDSLDWCFGTTGRCDRASAAYRSNYVEWVVSEARRIGGGVVLMHDIQGVTARNLDTILTRMEGLGYTFGSLPTEGRTPGATPTPTPTPLPTGCTVSTTTANVRSAPNGTVVTMIPQSTAVTVRSVDGDWYSVSFNYQGRDWGTTASPVYMHRTVLACR